MSGQNRMLVRIWYTLCVNEGMCNYFTQKCPSEIPRRTSQKLETACYLFFLLIFVIRVFHVPNKRHLLKNERARFARKMETNGTVLFLLQILGTFMKGHL